jgi:putative ABC transport system permease protein
MSTLFPDLWQSLRSLRRSPGFTLAAILTLALGLSGALALATVVHEVILRPLPYPEPHRLVAVTIQDNRTPLNVVSPTDVEDLQRDSRLGQEFLLFSSGASICELELGERCRPGKSVEVDWNLLANLGSRPAAGRLFHREDRQDVAVLSFEGWQRIANGSTGVVGQRLMLNGKSLVVVGVAAKGLAIPGLQAGPDVYTVLDRKDGNRGGYFLACVARLKPGVPLARFQEELAIHSQALAEAYPHTNTGVRYCAEDLQKHLLGDRTLSMLLALGLAGFLLLIACVNVGHLFLTRSLDRRQDLALRCALGASTRALLRHHLLEGIGVGLPAAALGLGGAWLALDLLPRVFSGMEGLAHLRPQGAEVLLALVLVLATSLGFALLPLRQARNPRIATNLGSGTRTAPGARRTRAALVVTESALAVLMLAMGGLFLKSFLKALHQDPGYQLRHGVVFNLALPQGRYATPAATIAFQKELQSRLQGIPGVRGVVLSSGLPNGHGFLTITLGQAMPVTAPDETWPLVAMAGATPGYFRQMGIPLVAGRDFQPADQAGTARVAVISESAARRFFPGRSALGQRLQTRMGDDSAPDGLAFEVVGICGDVVAGDLRGKANPCCYYALSQSSRRQVEVALATELAPTALHGPIEACLQAMDPRLFVRDLDGLEALNLKRLADLHQATWLLGLFSGLGLLLGFLGVASVVSTQVANRTREIGLRMALGASVGRVLGLFVGEAMVHVGVGGALGVVLAAGLGKLVAARLFNTSPADPGVLLAAALAFCAAATLASLVPALRAARVHPSEALRVE